MLSVDLLSLFGAENFEEFCSLISSEKFISAAIALRIYWDAGIGALTIRHIVLRRIDR